MDAFKSFKLYTSMKLHFTRDDFNIFETRGNLKGSLSTFQSRKDVPIFERWARKYKDADYIKLVAANCMYGNPECAYNVEEAERNYLEYQKRRQSITKIFSDDLDLAETLDPQTLAQHLLGGRITIETCVILNEVLGTFEGEMPSIFSDVVRRIRKSSGFIRYSRDKIERTLKEKGHEIQRGS